MPSGQVDFNPLVQILGQSQNRQLRTDELAAAREDRNKMLELQQSRLGIAQSAEDRAQREADVLTERAKQSALQDITSAGTTQLDKDQAASGIGDELTQALEANRAQYASKLPPTSKEQALERFNSNVLKHLGAPEGTRLEDALTSAARDPQKQAIASAYTQAAKRLQGLPEESFPGGTKATPYDYSQEDALIKSYQDRAAKVDAQPISKVTSTVKDQLRDIVTGKNTSDVQKQAAGLQLAQMAKNENDIAIARSKFNTSTQKGIKVDNDKFTYSDAKKDIMDTFTNVKLIGKDNDDIVRELLNPLTKDYEGVLSYREIADMLKKHQTNPFFTSGTIEEGLQYFQQEANKMVNRKLMNQSVESIKY